MVVFEFYSRSEFNSRAQRSLQTFEIQSYEIQSHETQSFEIQTHEIQSYEILAATLGDIGPDPG